jgi:hypothetical protein
MISLEVLGNARESIPASWIFHGSKKDLYATARLHFARFCLIRRRIG